VCVVRFFGVLLVVCDSERTLEGLQNLV
jgi:hypothetical protein